MTSSILEKLYNIFLAVTIAIHGIQYPRYIYIFFFSCCLLAVAVEIHGIQYVAHLLHVQSSRHQKIWASLSAGSKLPPCWLDVGNGTVTLLYSRLGNVNSGIWYVIGICTYTYIHTYLHTYLPTYIHTYILTVSCCQNLEYLLCFNFQRLKYIYIYICIYIYVYTFIYIYTYVYIHIYT